MGKKTYIGINNVSALAKKAYIGVGGVARQIKKIYLGIENVAREIFGGKSEVVYKGTIENFKYARFDASATTLKDYALFAGGKASNSSNGKYFEVYNNTLTKIDTSVMLQAPTKGMGAGTIGNHSLFCGGADTSDTYNTARNYTNVIDELLTITRGTVLSQARINMSVVKNENHLLFAGGEASNGNWASAKYNNVDVYDSELTRTQATPLTHAHATAPATSINGYALIGGGVGKGSTNKSFDVVAYDRDLVQTSLENMEGNFTIDFACPASTVGKFALLGSNASDIINVYNTNLTKQLSITSLLTGSQMEGVSFTTLGDNAVWGFGGYAAERHNKVVCIDEELTQTLKNGSIFRNMTSATTIGNFALFGGGSNGASKSGSVASGSLTQYNVVDVFRLA